MQPLFTAPQSPRYTEIPFPAYRYLPFVAGIPHPRRDPNGHSYAQEEEHLSNFFAADWKTCSAFLHGVDLFNYGYWWEAHEAWEAIWFAAGQETQIGHFVQGLIQLAAAQLKRFTGEAKGAKMLTESGAAKLAVADGTFLGIEISLLIAAVERCLQEDRGEYPQICLVF